MEVTISAVVLAKIILMYDATPDCEYSQPQPQIFANTSRFVQNFNTPFIYYTHRIIPKSDVSFTANNNNFAEKIYA